MLRSDQTDKAFEFKNIEDLKDFLYSDPSKIDKILFNRNFIRACLKSNLRFEITKFFMNKVLEENDIRFGPAFRVMAYCQREGLIPSSSISSKLDPDNEEVQLWKKYWVSEIQVAQHIWLLSQNYDAMMETVRGIAAYALFSLKIFQDKNINEHKNSYIQLREACDNLRIIKRQTYNFLDEEDKAFLDKAIQQMELYESEIDLNNIVNN